MVMMMMMMMMNLLRSMSDDMYVFSANCPVTYVGIRQRFWEVH